MSAEKRKIAKALAGLVVALDGLQRPPEGARGVLGIESIDRLLDDYADEILALALLLLSLAITPDEFYARGVFVIERFVARVYLAGSEGEPMTIDAMFELAQRRSELEIGLQSLMRDIASGRYSEQTQEGPDGVTEVIQTAATGIALLTARMTLWSVSLAGVYAIAQLYREGSRKYMWRLGGTIEHCSDCARLDGQVHSQFVWRLSPWRPQGRNLECGGWRCDCSLIEVPDDTPETEIDPFENWTEE